MTPRVVEVVRRGRRGSDGISGVVNVLRLTESTTLSTSSRGSAVIADAALTITLPTAPSVGQGWSAIISAQGGAITLSSPSVINGSGGDLALPQGYSIQIYTDGVEYLAQFFVSSEIATVNSNGVGNESDVPGATVTEALDDLDAIARDPAPEVAPGQEDFNLYENPITLTIDGTWGNGPDGIAVYAGFLRVYERTGTTGARVSQILYLETEAFIRSGTGEPIAWGDWRRIDYPELSQAQAEDETDTTMGVVSGERLAQAVEANQTLIEPIYTASEASWYNIWIKRSHGLGREPKLVMTYLECTTANSGYAVGDRLLFGSGQSHAGGYNGAHVYANDTEIGVFCLFITARDKSTGANVSINADNNWTLHIQAW